MLVNKTKPFGLMYVIAPLDKKENVCVLYDRVIFFQHLFKGNSLLYYFAIFSPLEPIQFLKQNFLESLKTSSEAAQTLK